MNLYQIRLTIKLRYLIGSIVFEIYMLIHHEAERVEIKPRIVKRFEIYIPSQKIDTLSSDNIIVAVSNSFRVTKRFHLRLGNNSSELI